LFSFEFISNRCSIRIQCGEQISSSGVWCPPIRSMEAETPSFRLFGWLSGFSPPRIPSETLTTLATLLQWLLLFTGILPAFAIAFFFALLTSSADLFVRHRGEKPWVVEVVSGVKLVAFVPRRSSSFLCSLCLPRHCSAWRLQALWELLRPLPAIQS